MIPIFYAHRSTHVDSTRHGKFMAKLIIPGPQEENEGRVFLETFGVSSIILGTLLFIATMQLLLPSSAPVSDASSKVTYKQRAEKLKVSYAIVEKLQAKPKAILAGEHLWTYEEAEAVFMHGPKVFSEQACTAIFEDKKSPQKPLTAEQDATLKEIMIASTLNHEAWAPHACLIRGYLTGVFEKESKISMVSEATWNTFKLMELALEDSLWILGSYQATKRLPPPEEFLPWLRSCSLQVELKVWISCVGLMHDLAPNYGIDLLDMIERHIVAEPMTSKDDYEEVTRLYAKILKKGYPTAIWPAHPSQNYPLFAWDARGVAALQLCRMLNSPNKDMVDAAARHLSTGASIQARRTTRVPRWRLACANVFAQIPITPPVDEEPSNSPQDASPDDMSSGDVSADQVDSQDDAIRVDAQNKRAVLTVWTGSKDDLPDYTLGSLIKQGICASNTVPYWRCSSMFWRLSAKDRTPVNEKLRSAFIQTRFIEMGDVWEPAVIRMARPEKTVPRKMMTLDEATFKTNTPK